MDVRSMLKDSDAEQLVEALLTERHAVDVTLDNKDVLSMTVLRVVCLYGVAVVGENAPSRRSKRRASSTDRATAHLQNDLAREIAVPFRFGEEPSL